MEGGPVSLKTHRKLGSDTSVKSLGPPDQEEQATIQPAKATHSNNVPTGLKTRLSWQLLHGPLEQRVPERPLTPTHHAEEVAGAISRSG